MKPSKLDIAKYKGEVLEQIMNWKRQEVLTARWGRFPSPRSRPLPSWPRRRWICRGANRPGRGLARHRRSQRQPLQGGNRA